jgi:recombination protein RecT
MNDTASTAVTVISEVRRALSNERTAAGIRATLPSTITYDHFSRVVETAIQTSPDIQQCTPQSVVAACVKCAEMGLLPDGQEAAIVKFNVKIKGRDGAKDRWEARAQTIPMIYGLRKQVQQSGEVLWWRSEIVRKGDLFRYVLGDEPSLTHDPRIDTREDDRDDAPITHVYAIAKLKSGELMREVMSIREVEKIRARSKQGEFGPWANDFPEMARKTVMRRQHKSLPRAKDPAQALFAAKAIRALDEAMEVIEVEAEPVPQLSEQDRAARKLAEAGGGIADQQSEAAPKTRKRRTPQERLDEAKAANAAPSDAPATEPEEMPDGPDFATHGLNPSDPTHLELIEAVRTGWQACLDIRPRSVPMAYGRRGDLADCWRAGYDEAQRRMSGEAAPSSEASEDEKDAIAGKAFI